MTISYVSAPQPIWYFVQLNGLPAGSGQLFTWSSLNPTQPKFAFQDASNLNPWTSPIDIDENGTRGPFFWQLNSADPTDLYNLILYDVNGNIIWQINDFPQGVSGGGGGGNIVTDLNNLVSNNVFYHAEPASASPVPLNYLIAPSVHSGFKSSVISGTSLSDGFGDIRFRKDVDVCTDRITITQFLTGEDALTGDITPRQYCNYISNDVIGDANKYYEIPLLSDVQSLSNNQISVSVWARANTINQTIILQIYQFFGDGIGASSPVATTFHTENLVDGVWNQVTATTTVASVSGKNIGPCGNAATYLRIYVPTTIKADIDITKPSVYPGPAFANNEIQTYDQIESIVNGFRTGDLKAGYSAYSPYGWLLLNDGTIGNVSSNATMRANIDTFPLFDLIWTLINNTNAPIFTSGGIASTRGVSSIADFTANKQLRIPLQLGRALSSAGSATGVSPVLTFGLGASTGEVVHAITVPELAPHTHTLPGVVGSTFPTVRGMEEDILGVPGTKVTGSTGSGQPFGIIQPTTYSNIFIKL